MSGKKQHIIPQFFQRNFSKTNKIYRYNKDGKFFGISIGDNYAENYAYSSSSDMTLDTKITDEETHIFSTLNKLLEQETDSEYIIDNEVNRFVLHFFLRNKYIFDGLYEKMLKDLEYISEFNENEFINHINNIYSKNRSVLTSNNIDIVSFQNICNKPIKKIMEKFNETLLNFKKSKVMYEFGSDTKTAHVLNDFKYRLENRDSLICADTIFCSYDLSNKNYCPYIDKNTNHIIFPLSKTKLLVLYKEDVSLTDNEIEKALISCCYNSFSIDIKNEYYSNICRNIKTAEYYCTNFWGDNIANEKNKFKNKIYNTILIVISTIKKEKKRKK